MDSPVERLSSSSKEAIGRFSETSARIQVKVRKSNLDSHHHHHTVATPTRRSLSSFSRDSFASAFPSPPSSTTSSPVKRTSLLRTMKRTMASPPLSSSHSSSTKPQCKYISGSSSTGSPRPVAVPHTITERHGGMELWVKAPMLAGEMEKQGFRWRKKWKTRYVELNSRMLSYYEIADDHHGHVAKKARKRAQITADGFLEDIDERSFSVTPSADEKPWVFRASDAKTKMKWCKALTDCIDILNWLQHYELGDVLGVGGNGVVNQIVDTRNGKQFAVKSVDVSKFKNREAVVSEVEIMRNITNNIKHPNLVKIYKVYEEQDKIYIIMELCTGGELYDSIVKRGCYSEADAADIMKQLLSALQALHKYNILHLDIKPENILLSSKEKDAKIVLTDFGLARMVNGKKNPLQGGTSMAGTVGYIAPEVISSHNYTAAADVFSAGVILFILLVGYPPFQGDSEVEILLKIARGDFQFKNEDWAHISTPAKELVSRMLEVRADERITVDEVLNHPWFNEVRSDCELAKTMERLQRFNFDRKSENMGSFMSSMLSDVTEADYRTLVDIKTIRTMISQLSPEGKDRIPLGKAHLIAKGLGLSPYVDEKSFVGFLDQNHDGFIDAQDFCEGVKAVRDHDTSFAKIIYVAMHKVIEEDTCAPSPLDHKLTRKDFETVFEKLNCPEPLVKVFFKYIDEQGQRPDDGSSDDADPVELVQQTGEDWEVDENQFVDVFAQFPFIGSLFLRTAKDNMTMIVKSKSIDLFPRISEDSSA
uniref:Uncharacterized protein n=1 Tax=Globisporangium ultimum (strain ATCC 200006 / CBS 805.95 / DAOM BR144) TaxID=431595 RepID=K3WH13_GLOUD